MTSRSARYLLPDLLRTIAIIAMVIYHFVCDLEYFYSWNVDPYSGGWWLFARTTAALFLFVVGLSAAIRLQRNTYTARCETKRAAWLLFYALCITVVTYFVDAEYYIRFGILHCIGISLLLMQLIPRRLDIGIGLLCLMLGIITQSFHTQQTELLLLLNIRPVGYHSFDTFPLIPWLGLVLLGRAAGTWLLPYMHSYQGHWLLWPGRHTLAIYLIHQPVLVAILKLLQ